MLRKLQIIIKLRIRRIHAGNNQFKELQDHKRFGTLCCFCNHILLHELLWTALCFNFVNVIQCNCSLNSPIIVEFCLSFLVLVCLQKFTDFFPIIEEWIFLAPQQRGNPSPPIWATLSSFFGRHKQQFACITK